MDIRKAHTAEHIFMKALYSVNETVRVLKVEHKHNVNHVIVKAEKLDWEDILKAAKIANMIILEDRRVSVEKYSSFEEARKIYPDLRAYEERIHPPIRVVVVEGYDYAACKMPHVEKTGECIMFLPISYRREKRKYIIDFLVAEQALEKALDNQKLVSMLASKLEIDYNRLIDKVDKLLNEEREAAKRIRKLTRIIFENAQVLSDIYKIKIIRGEGLDMKMIGEMTDEWIREGDRLVITLNRKTDKTEILIASSKNIDKDLSVIARELFKMFGGKGGGRRNWIMGYIEKDEEIPQYIIKKLR